MSPLIALPILLAIGCIALVAAVLVIDAMDSKGADDPAGQLPDPDSAADPGDRPSRAGDPFFHDSPIAQRGQTDHV